MKKKDFKKTGMAIAAVPVIAAGTVAVVSAYKQGMEFKPSDSKLQFQANKVVFEDKESTLGEKNSRQSDESRLLQQQQDDKSSESGTNLQDQAQYLFENEKTQQELPSEHTVNIQTPEDSGELQPSDTTDTNTSQDQQEPVYQVIQDPGSADLTVKGNQGTLPAGTIENTTNPTRPGNGNGNGTTPANPGNGNTGDPSVPGNGDNAGGTTTDPIVTPAPTAVPNPTIAPVRPTTAPEPTGIPEPTRTPEPTQTPDPEPTQTPGKRPVESAKDPDTSKKQPSDFNQGMWNNKNFEDGVEPGETSQGEPAVVIQQIYTYETDAIYRGQTVSQRDIFNMLDTYVIGKDGNRYLWGADALDKYVRIEAVSFDDGETWIEDFPVTIPTDLSSSKIKIRAGYRLSEKEDTWQQKDISYEVQGSRVFVLLKQITEEDTVLSDEYVVPGEQYLDIGATVNLLSKESYLLGNDGEKVTELFPGWMENGKQVPWFYPVTVGRHVLEPMDSVPLDSRYNVEMKHYWASKDLEIDDSYSNLAYLQTLTDYYENGYPEIAVADGAGWSEKHRCGTLTVPKYVQAVDINADSGLAVDYLEVPDTVLYIETVNDGMRVEKGFRVDKNNPSYTATKEGILLNKAETKMLGIPYELTKVRVPANIEKVKIPEENQIRTLYLEASSLDEMPEINYAYLNHCTIVVKKDLLGEFLRKYQEVLENGTGNCVTAEEDMDTTYIMKDGMIISNTGRLCSILQSQRTSLQLPDEVTQIGSEAFANAETITSLVLPKGGGKVTLEKDCLKVTSLQKIRCYTMQQYREIQEELENAGAPEGLVLELVGVSKEGIHYITTEQDGKETAELISVPSDIQAFDGVVTAEDGTQVEITKIGDSAFAECTQLEWVTLPESVDTIGYRAFYNCTSLQGILIRATEKIVLGDQFTEGCTSIRFIGSNAMTCEAPEGYEANIKDSFGNSFFYVPTNAEGYPAGTIGFVEAAGVTGYDVTDIGGGCRMLFATGDDAGMWLGIRSGSRVPKVVELPETIIEMFSYAMADTFCLDGAFTVDWQASPNLQYLDDGAFYNSDLGGDLTLFANSYVGDFAFSECRKLTSVVVPGDYVRLGWNAFENCSNLQSVSLGTFAEGSSMRSGLFNGCESLTELKLENVTPPELIVMGNLGFQFDLTCSAEEEKERLHIEVPKGQEWAYIKAWRYIFAGYYDLGSDSAYQVMWSDVQWNHMNWDTWEFPTDEEVDQLVKEQLLTAENRLRTMLGMEEVAEPEGFYPYRVESGMVTLAGAPSYITSLTLDADTLDFPKGWYLDYIGTNAFSGSPDLQEVVIPETLAGIWTNAFGGTRNEICTLQFTGSTPPELLGFTENSPFVFGEDESKIQIRVPEGSEKTYLAAFEFPMAGYADLNDLISAIQFRMLDEGKELDDAAVYEEAGNLLLPVENRLRKMMGMEEITDIMDLSCELPDLLKEVQNKEDNKEEAGNTEEKEPGTTAGQDNKQPGNVEAGAEEKPELPDHQEEAGEEAKPETPEEADPAEDTKQNPSDEADTVEKADSTTDPEPDSAEEKNTAEDAKDSSAAEEQEAGESEEPAVTEEQSEAEPKAEEKAAEISIEALTEQLEQYADEAAVQYASGEDF